MRICCLIVIKLRKETPEEIRKDTLENPPDLKLGHISRDTIYKQVLKEASESRPKKVEAKRENASQKKPPENKSPLSNKAKDLIYGFDDAKDSAQLKTHFKHEENGKYYL